MPAPAPRRVLAWSTRTLYLTAPGALFVLAAWSFRWDWAYPSERPFALLMAYQLLLMMSVGAAAVALLAGVHLAVHEAFRAGLETGRASVDPDGVDPLKRAQQRRRKGERDPLLRLVDGDDGTT